MMVLRVLIVVLSIGIASVAAAQSWVPQRHVELIAPNAPGGAMDSTARIVQRQWQEKKLLPVSSAVANRSGGEHALAYTYLSQRTGDPHFLSLASPVLLANHLAGRLSVTYTDVTPVATIMTEAYVFVVRADSPLKSGRDFVDALKARPDSLSIAINTILTRIATGRVLQSAGIDIKPVKMVVLESSKQLTALLGGHLDVAVGSAVGFLPQVEAGNLRLLAVTGSKRLTGTFAATPTWAEQGHPAAVSETWRAILAPKGISPAQIAYWERLMYQVAASDEFRKSAERVQGEAIFKNAAETRKHMAAEYAQAKNVMTYLGLIK
ncbi:MAG: tripartite tricarboxylate transporter substrate binding protein [Burkholderiales bacterium]